MAVITDESLCPIDFTIQDKNTPKQMFAMHSESSQTPSSTPHMLLKAHLFWCIFILYSKVNGTQTVILKMTPF